jgi:hypothetical protein
VNAERELNRLLVRQLRRLGISGSDAAPGPEAWRQLLQTVSRTYASAEEDRYLLERSLDLSSQEMQALNENLRQASETRLAAERDRNASVLTALSDGCACSTTGARCWRPTPRRRRCSASTRRVCAASRCWPGSGCTRSRAGTRWGWAVALGFVVGQGQTLRYDRSMLLGPGREERPVACVLTPLWVHGEQAGAVFVFRDTTESRQAERELLRTSEALVEARDRALRASRTKSVFLANMSHELRTPLNAILGYSELMEEEAESVGQAQVVQDAGRIRSAATHLLQLINDILDVSKIEAGQDAPRM